MLKHYGFVMRSKSSHHVFTRTDVREIINLQPGKAGKAKPYQVRQVADLIHRYQIQ